MGTLVLGARNLRRGGRPLSKHSVRLRSGLVHGRYLSRQDADGAQV
jgi:hypothetical protein